MSEEMAVPEQEGEGPEPALADGVVNVGQRLRLAREARGISIGDASVALKLSPRQVEAMEAEDWFQWPKTVIRGFVRNYARYLELDAGLLMEALDRVSMPTGPELVVGIGSPVNMPREGEGDRRDYVRVVAGLIALVLALLAYFFVPAEMWRSSVDSIKAFVSVKEGGDTAEEAVSASDKVSDAEQAAPEAPVTAIIPAVNIPAAVEPVAEAVSEAVAPLPDVGSVPAVSVPVPAPAIPAPVPVVPAPAELPVAPSSSGSSGGTLAFSFTESSWVEVRDRGGQVVFSQLNPAGSQREVTGRPPFALVIGNASHVSLQYKGKSVNLSQRSKDDVARFTLE
jgi:cytoskeleton protein RodZ